MKAIEIIKTLSSRYKEYLIGEQANIERIPFYAKAGVLTSKGEIENADPRFRLVQGADFSLVAATNAQTVMSVKNLNHKQALLILKAGAATTSWDWALKVSMFGYARRILANGKGGSLYFKDAIASGNPQYELLSNLPYGEGVDIIIDCDNNHGTTAIVISPALYFFDPVR